MNDNTRKKIRDTILSNMGVTEEEFRSWKTKDYSCDRETMDKFLLSTSGSSRIHIFGDYDCDGICSTYIMSRFLARMMGSVPFCHLPGRMSDGYGLKDKQIERIYEEDKDLLKKHKITIVTVDNGISSLDAIKRAKDMGYEVIVTDHHIAGEKLPDANLIIDPKAEACNPFRFDGYCGAGVAYKICEAFAPTLGFNEEELFELKSFAALATIADVMPLVEENHVIVSDILDEFRKGHIPYSLKLLIDQLGIEYDTITEKNFGFDLGPIMNAAGRMMDNGAERVFKYLCNPTEDEARFLISKNAERKEWTKTEYGDLLPSVVFKDAEIEPGKISPIKAFERGLHEGILGILAGKFCEEFGQPVIVLTDAIDGNIKGSARSVLGFSMYDYLRSIKEEHPDWLIGFGGHTGAAGLTVNAEHLNEFINDKKIFDREEVKGEEYDSLDCIKISKDDIPEAFAILREFAPFGEGNPLPLFCVYFHTFYDHPFMIGHNKDIMVYKSNEFKIKCFDYPSKLPNPKLKKLNLIGEISMDSFMGVTNPTLNVVKIEEYGVQKEYKKEQAETRETIMEDMEDNDGEIDYSE